jgi:hypothetical protein
MTIADVGPQIRFALHLMRKRPTLSAVATLCLAVGIGLATAAFTVVYGAFLAPLPVPGGERIVMVHEYDRRGSFNVPMTAAVHEPPAAEHIVRRVGRLVQPQRHARGCARSQRRCGGQSGLRVAEHARSDRRRADTRASAGRIRYRAGTHSGRRDRPQRLAHPIRIRFHRPRTGRRHRRPANIT